MEELIPDIKKELGTKDEFEKRDRLDLLQEKELKEANECVAYAEKEGFISDSENWSDEEKVDYYHKSQAYDN